MKDLAVMVMAKRPQPGRSKTRLTPPYSAKMAAGLSEAFLRDVLTLVGAITAVTPFVAYAPPSEVAYFQHLAQGFALIPQLGESLGERLDHVLTSCLERGFERVVALSSDTPNLPMEYLSQAFSNLREPEIDVVLGPCDDGGYYLIGVKARPSHLVLDVQMSTPFVLKDTLAVADDENLSVHLLPAWYDVDTMSDLQRLQEDLSARHTMQTPYTRAFLESVQLVS
ncbi:MAG: glycosyltransferase [Chloroflexi bacterium]|nr:glycosyltransferase [Chloroflexota bacterium]